MARNFCPAGCRPAGMLCLVALIGLSSSSQGWSQTPTEAARRDGFALVAGAGAVSDSSGTSAAAVASVEWEPHPQFAVQGGIASPHGAGVGGLGG